MNQGEMNTSFSVKTNKKAFEFEYMTEWREEVRFLNDRDIKPSFIKTKVVDTYRIKQYKYKKTPELFAALADFYLQKQRQRECAQIDRQLAEAERQVAD